MSEEPVNLTQQIILSTAPRLGGTLDSPEQAGSKMRSSLRLGNSQLRIRRGSPGSAKWRGVILRAIFLLGFLPGLGLAAESADSKLLLVGIQQQGRQQAGVSRAVERRLERMVEPYRLPKPALTVEQRACRALECLVEIAQTQHAERLLGGDITSPLDQLTVVTVWLFDARSRQSAESEARCERCDAEALEESVANATARLLEKYPSDKPLNTSVTPVGPAVPLPGGPEAPKNCPEVQCSGKDPLAAKRQTRLIAASVLGTLLGVTLITSIALTAVDTSGDHLCRLTSAYDMRACPSLTGVYGAGYALSAAFAAGLTLSLALPIK